MYFNEEQNSTNIDNEFTDEKKSSFSLNFLKNKYFLIMAIIIGLLAVVYFFVVNKPEKIEYFLELNGLEDMTVYQNSTFVDPGYKAYDNKGNDYTEEVIVTGYVETTVAGEYILQYTFNEIVKERIITVIGNINQVTYLNLIGNQVIYLNVGEEYQEPGYVVLDSLEDNLENKVTVTGEVNTKVAGTYKLVYSVVNNSGITINAERTIIVMDSDVSVSYSPKEVTNKEITIMINVVSNYFDYILLPTGLKSNERTLSYKVNENGEYNFEIYSKDGSVQKELIKISNIDKVAPVVSNCSAKINSNNTSISVNAIDQDSGISTYNYYINNALTKQGTTNSYQYNGINVNTVKVVVMDKAGNFNEKECTIARPLPSSSSRPSSSSSKKSSSKKSSSKKSSSKSSGSTYIPIGGTTYYTAFGSQYVVPKTKNDLKTFANMVDGKISQTALDTCHSNCLSVSQYHAYVIQYGDLDIMNVQDACNWKYATKLKTVFYDTSMEVLYRVYEEINAGKVLIIQVNGGSGRHFALAVGYRSSVKRKENMTEADLLIIDSWDGKLETMDKTISPKGRYLWKRPTEGWRVDVLK